MALQVLEPVKGSLFCNSGPMTIKWDPDAAAPTGYHIQLYLNGVFQTDIALNATGDSYVWTIPPTGYESNYYFVRVTNNTTPAEFDDSELFSIDQVAPLTVAVTSPAPNAILSGTVPLFASATDGVGIESVEYEYRSGAAGDWTSIGYATSDPWKVSWDTTCIVPDGSYEIRAIAYDRCGHTLESTPIPVTIENIPSHYVQVLIDDPLCIPPYKPEAEQIVDFKVCVDITDLQVFPAYKATKILVLGDVSIEVLYVANVPEQTVHTAHFNVPLKTFIKWEENAQGIGLNPCDILEPVIVCEHVEYKLVNPRTIVKSIVLFIGIKNISTDL